MNAEFSALERLESEGLIVKDGSNWKTTRRWQRGMARAAVKLYEQKDSGEDLRVPIVLALIETCKGELDDDAIVEMVEVMLPIEVASLGLGLRNGAENPVASSHI